MSQVEVARVFDELIAGTMTREAAEVWAEERVRAEDQRVLEYEPRSAENRLRDAIHYLSGVAIRTGRDAYLHEDDDFRRYRSAAEL